MVEGEKNILLYYDVCCGSRRNLASSCNWQGKGGRAGGSYELDAARSIQHKLLFRILDLPGGILLKAQEPSKFSFLLLVM